MVIPSPNGVVDVEAGNPSDSKVAVEGGAEYTKRWNPGGRNLMPYGANRQRRDACAFEYNRRCV